VTSDKASPPNGGDAEDDEVNGPAPPEVDTATDASAREANDAADPAEAEAPAPDARTAEAGPTPDDGTGAAQTGPDEATATAEMAEAGETSDDEDDPTGPSEDGDGVAVDVADEVLRAAAEALEVDLELLLAEREQYLDAYRRAQADFENYRKQAQKRQDDAVVRSLGSFVEGLLPVLDSCDAALAHGAGEVEPVLSALYGALAKEGLERIDSKGSAFDPAEAEAVVHEPGEGGEQIVAEVLRPGYRWRGRVLRPAMVKVTD
jgi:molecular chaperone GrpE